MTGGLNVTMSCDIDCIDRLPIPFISSVAVRFTQWREDQLNMDFCDVAAKNMTRAANLLVHAHTPTQTRSSLRKFGYDAYFEGLCTESSEDSVYGDHRKKLVINHLLMNVFTGIKVYFI